MGRHKKFKSKEILQELIDKYFDNCDDKEIPYTVTGLALALDTSRKVLMEYQKTGEFRSTLERAKARCEHYAELRLYTSPHVTGVIFSLKNNYEWKDKLDLGHGNEEDAEGKPKAWKVEVTHVTKEKS